MVEKLWTLLKEYRGKCKKWWERRTGVIGEDWMLPTVGTLKFNIDAAIFYKENAREVGVIVKNEKGEWVFALSKKIMGKIQSFWVKFWLGRKR